jgi:hypothetical protein
MPNISVGTLGSWSLIIGPVLAVVCYLIQPGVMLIDQADPSNAQATMGALMGTPTLSQVTAMLIPLGLIMFLFGMNVIGSSVTGNGEGLYRYGGQLFLIAVIGWTIGSALNGAIGGMTGAQAAAVGGAVYAVGDSIGTIAGIIAAIGVICYGLALSGRDGFNRNAALIVALAALVALVTTVWGAMDSSFRETGTMIGGIFFMIVTAWSVMLGLGLRKSA